jgi:uncharacterized repeat protein (TIGR01451 family)
VFVGSEPGKLALSDDGNYLYVALDGAAAVRRVNLPSLTLGPRFALAFHTSFGFEQVWDMKVQPGRPEVLVVITRHAGNSGFAGMAVYDRGVRRGTSLPSQRAPSTIEFSLTPGRLYGLGILTGSGVAHLEVNASGVSITREIPLPLISGSLTLEGGLLYTSTGQIIDPELGTLVGHVPIDRQRSDGAVVAPDLSVGRIFALIRYRDSARLLAFDARKLLLVGSMAVPPVSAHVGSLVRWGRDGIAYRTEDDQLFLIRTDLVPSGGLALAVEPLAVQGAGGAMGKVVLRQPAGSGGAVVLLASEQPEVGGVPSQVTVPAGATSASFPITTAGGEKAIAVPIRATYGEEVARAGLQVLPPPGPRETLAGGSSFRRVKLPARDLAFDPHARRLYASVPSRIGGIGGSIAMLDPVSGALLGTIPVGPEPGKLALSDDGRYLYVALDGAAAVRRLDLTSQTAGLQFSLGSDPTRGPYYVYDMEVAPGQPDVVAVSEYNLNLGHAGIAIYDAGVARPQKTLPGTDVAPIEFGATPSRLYTANSTRFTSRRLRRLIVDAQGVREESAFFPQGFFPGRDMRFDSGLLVTASGGLIDPETGEMLGSFGIGDGALVQPELRKDRVFFLGPWGPARNNLLVYNPRTLAQVGRVELPEVFGEPRSLVRWGADGLAFHVDPDLLINEFDQILLLRSPLVSGVSGADLSLALSATPQPVRVGEPLTVTITVANAGPQAATNVVLAHTLPAEVAFVSAASTRGSCKVSGRELTCNLGALAVDESLTVTLVVTPLRAGALSAAFTVRAAETDPDPTGNSASVSPTVVADPGCAEDVTGAVRILRGPLRYDAGTRRYLQTVQVANIGSRPLTGPLSLALAGLGRVELANSVGKTRCRAPLGSPYVNVEVGPDSLLAPGEVAGVALEFVIPAGHRLAYRPRVLAGNGGR